MKLVRYAGSLGTAGWGCISGDSVFPVEGDPLDCPRIGSIGTSLHSVRLLAPCEPRKVIGIAINFRGATGLTDGMSEPLVFLKAGTSVCGAEDDIVCPFAGAK